MAKAYVGAKGSMEVEITDALVRGFAEVSGDYNPIHLDDEFAAKTRFGRRIAHGMLAGALISGLLVSSDVPGPGAVYLGQTMKFKRPVFLGDRITVEAEVLSMDEKRGILKISTICKNQHGKVVVDGEATALLPEKA